MKRWLFAACLVVVCGRWSQAADPSATAAPTVLPQARLTSCTINPDGPSEPLRLRRDPRHATGVVALSAETKPLLRLDTQSLADGDWIEVKADGAQGWVKSARLICRASAEQAKALIADRAARVITLLQQRDLAALSPLAHPVKGLRFSPDAFLNKKTNVSLKAAQLPGALRDGRRRVWGTHDGSGEPIRLNFAEYYRRFVTDRDFTKATAIAYNGDRLGNSNTADNSVEEYPNALIVEYFLPGTRPEQQGMDWASLRLIFEQHRSEWYLVYIVHDRWSI